MSNYFQHKIVAITGATSGIGRALAESLLKNGAKVAVCGRNQAALDSMKEALKSSDLLTFQADVSAEDDCRQFIESTVQTFGGLDILINNAGISMRALFQDVDLAVLRKSMDINFWGTVYCCKFALPHLMKSHGSIAGISSIAGYKGLPCRTGYSSSKFAMQGFLESLRIELLHKNVNVLWISPGFVASNIRNTALNASGEAQKESPLQEKNLMTADVCALRILNAIEQRKRTLIMSSQGKLTVWINKFFPGFADRQVYKHFANEPDSPLK
ncbi:MAG: SDR family oxidoreductase [Chitinophagaceae bacterium]|nr:SDR family oxidoreductase [Chitinophagaceae bacterium]